MSEPTETPLANAAPGAREARAGKRVAVPAAGVVCALVAAHALFFIWRHRFLPLQDYPDWLYQGFLFSQAMKGTLSENYRVLLQPIPNAASTLAIGLFGLALPPEAAGKAVLSLYVLLLVAGTACLMSAVSAEAPPGPPNVGGARGGLAPGPLICIPLALLLNGMFFHGYLSYVLALGPLFLAAGYLVRRRTNPESVSARVIAGASLLLYLSHLLVYCAWGVVAALFLYLHRSRRVALRLVVGFLPSLALLALYALQVAGGDGDRRIFYGPHWLAGKLAMLFPTFHVLHAFYPVTDPGDPWVRRFGEVNLAFAAAVLLACGAGLWLARRERPYALPLLAAAALFALFLASPRYLAGNVLPDLRFLLPALWFLLAYVAPAVDRRPGAPARAAWVAGLAFLAAQACWLHTYAAAAAREAAATYAVMREGGVGEDFRAVFESHFNFEGRYRRDYHLPPFVAVHSPFARLPYYLNVEAHSEAPIFATGLIEDRLHRRPLDSVTALREMDETPRHLVIVGGEGGCRFIAGLLSERYRVSREARYVVVMERRPGW